jgi:DNA repair exonuclease SbcCD nuclease subunit
VEREIRILHTSDLHLDASFRSSGVRSARARERCQAHQEGFDRVVELAARVEADVLLVAGDLFEGAHARPATVRHVARRLGDWGRPVLVAPGNHDPLGTRSVYRLTDWPGNVTIFEARWSARNLPDLGLTVHGRGFAAPEESDWLLEGLEIEGSGPHVIVAHGSDVSCRPDRHHPYRPFQPRDLDRLPVEYVALGHYHGFSTLATERVRAVYCGSPVPQGFDETGAHGAVLARLGPQGVAVELLEIPARHFVTLDVDASGEDTQAGLAERARRALGEKGLERDFVRMRLVGSLPPDLELDMESLAEALASCAHDIEVRDATQPEYDLDVLGNDSTVRGLFVRALRAQIESAPDDGARERARRALYFGLDAFAGHSQPR